MRSAFSAPARLSSPPGSQEPRSRPVLSRTAASCSRLHDRSRGRQKSCPSNSTSPLKIRMHPSSPKPLQSWHFPNGSGGGAVVDAGLRRPHHRARSPAAEHHAARPALNRQNARAAWPGTTHPDSARRNHVSSRPPPRHDPPRLRPSQQRLIPPPRLRPSQQRPASTHPELRPSQERPATTPPHSARRRRVPRGGGAERSRRLGAPARAGQRPSTRDARRAPTRGQKRVSPSTEPDEL
jgi:hypothetical protein